MISPPWSRTAKVADRRLRLARAWFLLSILAAIGPRAWGSTTIPWGSADRACAVRRAAELADAIFIGTVTDTTYSKARGHFYTQYSMAPIHTIKSIVGTEQLLTLVEFGGTNGRIGEWPLGATQMKIGHSYLVFASWNTRFSRLFLHDQLLQGEIVAGTVVSMDGKRVSTLPAFLDSLAEFSAECLPRTQTDISDAVIEGTVVDIVFQGMPEHIGVSVADAAVQVKQVRLQRTGPALAPGQLVHVRLPKTQGAGVECGTSPLLRVGHEAVLFVSRKEDAWVLHPSAFAAWIGDGDVLAVLATVPGNGRQRDVVLRATRNTVYDAIQE